MTDLFGTEAVPKELVRPLSPSKLRDIKKGCGYYFKLKRVDKVDDGPSAPRDQGDILHRFQAHYLRHCQKTQQFSDLSAVESLLGRAIKDFEKKQKRQLNGIDRDELLDLALAIADLEPVELTTLCGIEQKAAFDGNGHQIDWWDAYKRKVGVWGIIDKLLYDPERKLATIKDLKTGFGRDIDSDQLVMYAWYASRLLPEAEMFELVFQYIRPFPATDRFPGEDLYYNREEVTDLMRELEQEKLPSYLKALEGFKPNPGPRCNTCPFATICEYRATEPGEVENKVQVERAIRDAMFLRAKAGKHLKAVREWFKRQADAVARRDFGSSIEDLPTDKQVGVYEHLLLDIDGESVGYVGKPADTWNKASLFALLRGFGLEPLDFFNVDKRKLGKLFRNTPEIKAAAEPFKGEEQKIRWEGT